MSQATSHMRHLAKRLLVFEMKQNNALEANLLLDFLVPEKLRLHLVALMGNGGFQALLTRALALAKTEVPWLRAMRVNASGSMEGLGELQNKPGADELLEGNIVLLAQLLGLLVAFIGDNLTLRLVREVWPKVPLEDLEIETRGKNEKAK